MSTHKSIDKICVAILLCTVLITILFMSGQRLGIQAVVDADAEANSDSVYFTANDLDGEWDSSSAAIITLQEDQIKVSGKGAYAYDGDVMITGAGLYVVTGSLADGKIVVDASSSAKIWILLDGVDITCSDDACLRVEQAEKVFLTLAAGTENTFSGGETYSEEAMADATGGAVFARDDLTINGSGSLTVLGPYKHGIDANDDLVITGGTLNIEAAADGIHVNDSFRLTGADIRIQAGDDGIAVTNEESGWFYMESGNVSVTASDDGIHAAGDVTVEGGSLTLEAGDDGLHSDTRVHIAEGVIRIPSCYEGIEAVRIEMDGGDVEIHSSDDGLNANGGSSGYGGGMMGGGRMGGGAMNGGWMGRTATDGAVTDGAVTNGTATDSAVTDGAVTDGAVTDGAVTDGAVTNGVMTDGAMANGTMTDAGMADRGAMGTPESTAETEETYIRISGGTLTVINETGRDADGLDSNGDIIITGGDIRVSLINSGSNSAIDYGSENGGVAEISGGTLVAAGSYSMAEHFDSTSEQASVLYIYSAGAEAGTMVSVEDAEGNPLISYEVPLSFSAVTISCPEMQIGETYRVCIGDEVQEITLDEVSASYGDGQSTMFGGTMNWGQMGKRGNRVEMGGGTQENMGSSREAWGGRGESRQNGMNQKGDDQGSTGNPPEPGELPEGFTLPEGESMPEGETMPEGESMPEGETMPDGNGFPGGPGMGAAPEPGELPEGFTLPEGETMPDAADIRERSGSGGMAGNPFRGSGDSAVQKQEETEADVQEAAARDAVTPEQWYWLGLSLAVLLAGLLFTRLFRRK